MLSLKSISILQKSVKIWVWFIIHVLCCIYAVCKTLVPAKQKNPPNYTNVPVWLFKVCVCSSYYYYYYCYYYYLFVMHHVQQNIIKYSKDKNKHSMQYKIQTECLHCPFKCGPEWKLNSIYCMVGMISVTYPNVVRKHCLQRRQCSKYLRTTLLCSSIMALLSYWTHGLLSMAPDWLPSTHLWKYRKKFVSEIVNSVVRPVCLLKLCNRVWVVAVDSSEMFPYPLWAVNGHRYLFSPQWLGC